MRFIYFRLCLPCAFAYIYKSSWCMNSFKSSSLAIVDKSKFRAQLNCSFFRRQRRFADHCSWWSWDHKKDQSQKIHHPEVEIILLVEMKVQLFVKTPKLGAFIAFGGNNGIQGWWKQVTIRLQKSHQKTHSLKLLHQGFTQSGAIPVQLSLMNVH